MPPSVIANRAGVGSSQPYKKSQNFSFSVLPNPSTMLPSSLGLLFSLAHFSSVVYAQANNPLYSLYPNDGTLVSNETIFIIPVDIDIVKKITTYPLLPLPSFFSNFPPNTHPVGESLT